MKRKVIIIAIIIIAIASIWYRSSLQDSEEKLHLYFMDIEKNTISQINDEKYNPSGIYWTNDSKHFMFKEINSAYSINSSKPDYRIIYSLPDLKRTKVIEDDNFKLSNYIDPYLFVRENKEAWDERDIPEDVQNKIRSYIGTDYIEALINYDRDKVIFTTPAPDFKVYIMDIKTGKTKLVAFGFDLQWSPNESKIIYSVHKYKKFDRLNGRESGEAEDYYTYMYDLNTDKTVKIADFGVVTYFSDNDRYLVFFKGSVNIPGFPGEI